MTSQRGAEAGRPADIEAVPVRHPGRWVAAAVIVVLLAMLVHAMVVQPGWGWHTVGKYLFNHRILQALGVTIELTVIAMVFGIVLGIILAVMRLSANPIVSSASWFYIWFFRGTPVIVQLLFWFNLAALFPTLSFGIPFGPNTATTSTNVLITTFVAAVLGLGLNEGAYMAEIVRSGIISVDPGQTEAAQALGLRRLQTMRHIVLPQAMRVIIPPTGNETISMLKTTSLVIVIALTPPDLLTQASLIYAVNYQTIPLLLVASIWYIVATSVLTVGQYYIERHYARGTRFVGETPLQRIRRTAFTWRREPLPTVPAPGRIDTTEDHR